MTAPDWFDAAVMALLGVLTVVGLVGYVLVFIVVRRKLRDWMPMECWIVAAFLVGLYSLAMLQ